MPERKRNRGGVVLREDPIAFPVHFGFDLRPHRDNNRLKAGGLENERGIIVRISIAATGMACVLALPAIASDRSDRALDAVIQCSALADDAARLKCFDEAAGAAKVALAPPSREEQTAGFGQTGPAAGEEDDGVSIFGLTLWEATTEEEFGAERIQRTEEGQITAVTALVTEFAYTPGGDAIVFLDNGHVWRQTDGPKIYFSSDPAARSVTISKELMGGYMLRVGELNRGYRIKRVK